LLGFGLLHLQGILTEQSAVPLGRKEELACGDPPALQAHCSLPQPPILPYCSPPHTVWELLLPRLHSPFFSFLA